MRDTLSSHAFWCLSRQVLPRPQHPALSFHNARRPQCLARCMQINTQITCTRAQPDEPPEKVQNAASPPIIVLVNPHISPLTILRGTISECYVEVPR